MTTVERPACACLSPNGQTVTTAVAPATLLHVATAGGLVTLQRDGVGAPWSAAHEALNDRHVSALVHESRSGKLFAASHAKGVAVSSDGGRTWHDCSAGIAHANVFTLALQYRGAAPVLFAGTEPAALFRSDDLGATWHELPALRNVPKTELWTFPPPPHIAHVKNVAFHPDAPATLYVSVEQGALLKSVDDGRSWVELDRYEDVQEDKFRHDIHRVLVKRSDPNWLFMLTGNGTYRSADAGRTWAYLTTRDYTIGYPDAGFIDPRNEDVLYIGGPRNAPRSWGIERCADATVMRSTDGGTSWHETRTGLPPLIVGNIEGMAMHHAGDQLMLAAGSATGEVFVSDDAGATWSTAASGLRPISKGGHYRWFLPEGEREKIEAGMRAAAS